MLITFDIRYNRLGSCNRRKIFVKYFSKQFEILQKKYVYYRIYSSQQSRKDKGQPKPNPDLGTNILVKRFYFIGDVTLQDCKIVARFKVDLE